MAEPGQDPSLLSLDPWLLSRPHTRFLPCRGLSVWTAQKRLTWASVHFLMPTAGDIRGYGQSFYFQLWPSSKKVTKVINPKETAKSRKRKRGEEESETLVSVSLWTSGTEAAGSHVWQVEALLEAA